VKGDKWEVGSGPAVENAPTHYPLPTTQKGD
jgi:hypothetical protein